MIDNFALLNQPRLPWLDPEELKQVFHQLSATLHPDRNHDISPAQRAEASQHFANLNAAYNCLREPKDRLRHLLQLEIGEKPADIQSVPADLMDWQFKVATVCREADQALAVNYAALSPLKKVECFQTSQEQAERLTELHSRILEKRESLYAELKALNPDWLATSPKEDRLKRLEEIYRLLGYFHRWSAQLHERITQLNLQSL